MKVLKILGIIVLALVILGIGAYLYMSSLEPENMEFADIDLSQLSDGVYPGEAKITPVKVKLDVTISGGAITSIEISEHVNGKGKEAEKITDRVIEAQSLDVDTITGATWSSYTILKAIETALLAK